MIVAVVGATGRTGRAVVERLVATDHSVVAVGRDASKLGTLHPGAERLVADLDDPTAMTAALARADRVASLAHARFTARLIDALAPTCERVVLTGSIRRDTQLPDPAADEVRAGEADFARSGRSGVMLHPSMIYGAPDDLNVDRILSLLRRWPRWLPVVVPLPAGGRSTVQPVFVDDMADAVVAALLVPGAAGPPIDVVGPRPITYASMVRECGRAVGRRVWVVPSIVATPLLALAGRLPLPISTDELARSGESKRYDPAPLVDRLGVRPREFADGLAVKLARAGDAVDVTG